MSGLCGWFSDDIPALPVSVMAASLGRFDQAPTRGDANSSGAVSLSAHPGHGQLLRDDGVIAAIWSDHAVPDLIALWRRHGTSVCEHVQGAFALAIVDGRTDEGLLAVDRSGIFPLCFQQVGRTLVFASNADTLIRHPCVSREIDPQAIFNYLYFHMVPAPGSIYRDQRRLLPGECLHWHAGRAARQQYWQMTFREHEPVSFAQQKLALLSTIRQAVARCAGNESVGCFLSGGTDSSSIAAMLAALGTNPPRTYSIGFDVPGYDELDYARLVAHHFNTDHQERYVTPDDVRDAIPAIASVFDQPFGNASAVPTFYCAQMARSDGLTRMLGGDGGDELFGGNERYARQAVFSRYEALPSALRQLLIEPALFRLGGSVETRLARKARSYIRQALVPLPARLETYNLLHHYGLGEIFDPHFLVGVEAGQPGMLMAEHYLQGSGCSQINQMLAYDLKFTLADNDLPKVGRACELAGIGVAFPLLDDAVVAFSAGLTPRQKLNGTRLRYFFKEAMRGTLPPEVLTKKKHGFGLPIGHWLATDARLRDYAYDSLSALKGRHLVRAGFIDELLNRHLPRQPAYHGTMVWLLMMLEQWFAQRRPAWNAAKTVTREEHARIADPN